MVLVKMKETAEAYLGKVTYDLNIHSHWSAKEWSI